jgi:hypothetical protein
MAQSPPCDFQPYSVVCSSLKEISKQCLGGLGSGFDFTVPGAILQMQRLYYRHQLIFTLLPASHLVGSIVGTSGWSPSAEFFARPRA